MIAVLVIVLANVFISYKWLDKNTFANTITNTAIIIFYLL